VDDTSPDSAVDDVSAVPKRPNRTGTMRSIRGAIKAEQKKKSFFTKRRPLWIYLVWAGLFYGGYQAYLYFVG